MFGDEKRFGTNLKAVANGSTIFAFGKQLDEGGSHVGPGAYFSTTKENIRAGWNKKGQNYRQPFGTIHSPDAASHYNTSIRSNNSQNRPQSAPRGRSNVSSTGVYQSPGPGHYNVPTSSLRINTSQPTAAASSSSSLHNQFFGVNPVAFGRTVNPMEVSMNAMGGLGGSSSSMLQSFSSRPLTPAAKRSVGTGSFGVNGMMLGSRGSPVRSHVREGVILSQVDYSNHFVGPGYYDPYPLDSHWVKKSFNVRLNSNAASSNGNANHGPPKRRNSFSMGVPPGVSSGSTGMNKQQRAGMKGKGASRASMDISTIEKPHASSQQPNHHHDAALSGAANGGDDAGLMDLLSLDTVHVGEHVAINKDKRPWSASSISLAQQRHHENSTQPPQQHLPQDAAATAGPHTQNHHHQQQQQQQQPLTNELLLQQQAAALLATRARRREKLNNAAASGESGAPPVVLRGKKKSTTSTISDVQQPLTSQQPPTNAPVDFLD